jgi:hypothetical protein
VESKIVFGHPRFREIGLSKWFGLIWYQNWNVVYYRELKARSSADEFFARRGNDQIATTQGTLQVAQHLPIASR